MRHLSADERYLEHLLKKPPKPKPQLVNGHAKPEIVTRLDMPEECLDGELGKICRNDMSDFPRAYAWMSLLAAASVKVDLKTRQRCNLYTASVGPKGSGKSSCDELAFRLMSVKHPVLVRLKAGSAEGLAEYMADAHGAQRLLYPDELGHLIDKAKIEHSSFPRILNTAFYEDEQELTVMKRKVVKFKSRLTAHGGIVEDEFGDLFNRVTTHGFYDRFLFGPCPDPYSLRWRDRSSAKAADLPRAVLVKVPRSVYDEIDHWRNGLKMERVAELALRAAVICASFDERTTLYVKDLGPAFALAQYQMRARILLQPNTGENSDSRCYVKVRNWLKEHPQTTRHELDRGIHASERLGPSVFNRCLREMSFNGVIEIDGKKIQLIKEKTRKK
jgi:hypothetical protein